MVFFDDYADEKDRACSFGTLWVWRLRKKQIESVSVEFFEYQDSDAREKTLIFQLSTRALIFGFSLWS